ncbi:MAG: radical SAM protein [Bacteroidales bacterium]|nr:radical SAM protein [Bacteroidales bacterium]
MMRILLVGNPKTVMGFNRMTKIPSLNLASIAANVDRRLCEVKIADLVVKDKNPHKALLKVLHDYKPQLVGLTAMSFQYNTALALAKTVREFDPDIKTVMGGYHVSGDSENILLSRDMEYLDFLIVGEGEIPFRELVKALSNGQVMSSVPGLSYLKDGKPVHNPRPPLADVSAIKIPDRSARIYKKGFHVMGVPGDVIETSRGCVYNCNFCSIRHMYGKSFRKYSIGRILEDLQDARNHGVRFIFITDDNITLDGKRYIELCESIIEAKLNMYFAVQASVRGIKQTPGLAKLMAESGTKIVFLGIENASDEVLKSMKKSDQLKSSDTFEVMEELHKYGIIVVGGFIFGYPDDNRETLMHNYRYAKKLKVDLQLFNILTPHLKTEIREDLLRDGFVTNPDDYSKYNHYAANVKTKHLTDKELYMIRNRMDARYPVESGGIFRFIRANPGFFFRLMLWMLRNEPKNWWSFVSGILNPKNYG